MRWKSGHRCAKNGAVIFSRVSLATRNNMSNLVKMAFLRGLPIDRLGRSPVCQTLSGKSCSFQVFRGQNGTYYWENTRFVAINYAEKHAVIVHRIKEHFWLWLYFLNFLSRTTFWGRFLGNFLLKKRGFDPFVRLGNGETRRCRTVD